jgi:predicted nucleic acid-binding protein
MSGNRILVDTNIILYLLSGSESIAQLINNSTIYISFITELEILSFKEISEKEKKQIKKIFNEFVIVDINEEIKSKTIEIRSNSSLKLPDSIIAATAQFLDLPLLTADKDFQRVKNLDLLLFEND